MGEKRLVVLQYVRVSSTGESTVKDIMKAGQERFPTGERQDQRYCMQDSKAWSYLAFVRDF